MVNESPSIEDDIDESAEVLPTVFSITAYGADFPVDGLVKRLESGDIVIPVFSEEPQPGQSVVSFQREFVWKKPQADRFVESLLLGLPVPGVFLVKEANSKYLVLDGQQRFRTLLGFYQGLLFGREFALEGVQPPWKGLTYRTLGADDRRRLDNSIIHATVVRQDEPTDDQSSIYLIFERLNSSGTILQPQEIRVALFHGPFSVLLSRLNDLEDWRALVGQKSARMKDVEMILRFFALHFRRETYSQPMKGFLNDFMGAKRYLKEEEQAEFRDLFARATRAIREGIGERAFRLKTVVNAAVVDSVMVGVAAGLAQGTLPSATKLKAGYDALLAEEPYVAAVTRATANEDTVKTRLRLAIEAFSGRA